MKGLATRRLAVVIALIAIVAALRLIIGASALDTPIRFAGELTFDQYEQVLEHSFTVPNGVARIDVALEYTGKERRTVLDLGLRSPSGVRGWSGGRESAVHVSTLTATPGYLPGPIEPGRWSVILGVPNIRHDSHDTYAVTITLDRKPLRTGSSLREEAAWYAGELHLHSGHSDARGTAMSGAPIPAPIHRVLDVALPTPKSALRPLLRRMTRQGAFLSINHPRRPDDETCMGCGWNDTTPGVFSAVHGVEAVNGADWNTPVYGWPFWADALNRGARLALVGGSDDHTPENTTDISAGSPTTVVFAASLSESDIVDGLKSGRTYVRVRGPKGPSIDFYAFVDGTVYGPGDTIYEPSSRIRFEAVVTGARGQTLQWIRRGVPVKTVHIGEDEEFDANLKAHPGDWFSLIVRDEIGPTLLTSAIYTE